MNPDIVVALIGVAGTIIVAMLNHHLTGRVKVQETELAWIKKLIGLVTSDRERAHLAAFAADGSFNQDIEPGSGFEWELRHLLSIDLIERIPGKGVRTLFNQKGNRDVKAHLVITQRGRDYLRMFQEASG
jgi:hypothetical protein